jgi:hypothetical protein
LSDRQDGDGVAHTKRPREHGEQDRSAAEAANGGKRGSHKRQRENDEYVKQVGQNALTLETTR